jgi:hypothetical protein
MMNCNKDGVSDLILSKSHNVRVESSLFSADRVDHRCLLDPWMPIASFWGLALFRQSGGSTSSGTVLTSLDKASGSSAGRVRH